MDLEAQVNKQQMNNKLQTMEVRTDENLMFPNDELAKSVWKSKYAQDNETHYDEMHKRMASEFVRIEEKYVKKEKDVDWSNLSEYGKKRDRLTYESIYGLFKDFKYIVPQGRIMAGLGIYDSYRSLSNCLRLPPPKDSYSSITYVDATLVAAAKRGCGYGLGISNLRPKGVHVKNSANSSTGAVSFMPRYSFSTREVAQDGRRGACLIDIDINHPDSLDFINSKKDRTQITGANISVKVNSEFMKAVENDERYVLRFPCDFYEKNETWVKDLEEGKNNAELNVLQPIISGNDTIGYTKVIKAKEYWNEIINNAWENAEPGVFFWDKVINYDPCSVYPQFQIDGTNACVIGNTEILTKDGYKEIYTLVDKEVEIWNGFEWSTVTPKITGYNQHMLKVTLSDGRELTSTDYHKWILAEGYTNKFKKVETKDLKIGDKIIKYNFPILKEGKQVSLKHAYTQGFISAEGMDDYRYFWLYEPKYVCKDRLDIRIEGAEFSNINEVKRKTIYYNDIYKEKSYVPFDWCLTSKIEWLSGLFDGDGTELIEGGLQLCSTDFTFLKDVQKLLSTLSINSKVINAQEEGNRMLPDGKGSLKEYFCQKSYRICIGAVQMQDLKSLGLDCARMSFDKTPQRDASQFVKIVKIEDAGYEDEVYCFNEPLKHFGIFNGILTGQCGEQPMCVYDTCRLILLNLFSFVDDPFTSEAKINEKLLYKYAYEQMRLGDDLVDLEIEYINRIIEKIKADPEPIEEKQIDLDLWKNVSKIAKEGRRVGCGITALADMIAALNLKYDSKEALDIVEKVMSIKMKAELDCTSDLAILRGTFIGWDSKLEWNGFEGNNDFYKFISHKFPIQFNKMMNQGRRNINWSTIAPAGTVSLMTQSTSGCEPLFSPYYFRRKKINPNEKNAKIDFVDQNGDSWTEFPVLHPKFKDWILITDPYFNFNITTKEELEILFTLSPYYKSTANDINWTKRVEMQSILQKYTTSAISTTLNLPQNITKEEVSEIYLQSWKKGLKGQTIYRDGSRSGVLVSESTKDKQTFEQKDAPKRPGELPCEIHHPTIKNTKYTVIVGLLDSKPYEVFAIPYEVAKGYKNGFLSKTKSGVYNLIASLDEKSTIHTNVTGDMSDTEAALTRLISTSLRHGAEIKFIVEQLNKTHGDLFSFSKVIARVLKKYIPEGAKSTVKCQDCGSENVIFQEGCQTCQSCGSSKCG